jgi:import inner membrane translocase subunit TIM54
MRRFELSPDDEARARALVITEEEIEGWTKRSLRSAWRWGVRKWRGEDGWRAPRIEGGEE